MTDVTKDERQRLTKAGALSPRLAEATPGLAIRLKNWLGLSPVRSNSTGNQLTVQSIQQPPALRPIEQPYEVPASPSDWARRALVRSFVAMVAIPTFFALVYFGLVASDEYVSETEISVRAASDQKQQLTDALALLGRIGASGAKSSVQDSYMVLDYIKSKPIIEDVGGREYIEKLFAKKEIDIFSRIGKDDPAEKIWKYWTRRVAPSLEAYSVHSGSSICSG